MPQKVLFLATAAILLGAGIGSFFGIRAIADDGNGNAPQGVARGGGPQPYPTPIPVMPGDWVPPATEPENVDRIPEVYAGEAGKPLFAGVVNGFRFYTKDDEFQRLPCESTAVSARNVTADALPFDVTYFPPGTAEEIHPYLQTCPDGTLHFAVRGFAIGAAGFSVAYFGGELAIQNDSIAEDRVQAAEVHGKAGVIVRPITPEGHGESIAVWPAMDGFMRIYATDLPLEETLKIAEGVTCEGC